MDYHNVIKIGALTGAMAMYSACEREPSMIKAEGFPQGYIIEKADIPTRGKIIRVEKLPGEEYQKTVDEKTGIITFTGNFEYEIKPLRNAMPQDSYHSDRYGRTPQNNRYWEDVRTGTITLRPVDSLERKIDK